MEIQVCTMIIYTHFKKNHRIINRKIFINGIPKIILHYDQEYL